MEYGAAFVSESGCGASYGSDNREKMGVRPVIYIDLSKTELWSVAGKVKSTDVPIKDGQDTDKKDPSASQPTSTPIMSPEKDDAAKTTTVLPSEKIIQMQRIKKKNRLFQIKSIQ